jgi:hypothetical protein
VHLFQHVLACDAKEERARFVAFVGELSEMGTGFVAPLVEAMVLGFKKPLEVSGLPGLEGYFIADALPDNFAQMRQAARGRYLAELNENIKSGRGLAPQVPADDKEIIEYSVDGRTRYHYPTDTRKLLRRKKRPVIIVGAEEVIKRALLDTGIKAHRIIDNGLGAEGEVELYSGSCYLSGTEARFIQPDPEEFLGRAREFVASENSPYQDLSEFAEDVQEPGTPAYDFMIGWLNPYNESCLQWPDSYATEFRCILAGFFAKARKAKEDDSARIPELRVWVIGAAEGQEPMRLAYEVLRFQDEINAQQDRQAKINLGRD